MTTVNDKTTNETLTSTDTELSIASADTSYLNRFRDAIDALQSAVSRSLSDADTLRIDFHPIANELDDIFNALENANETLRQLSDLVSLELVERKTNRYKQILRENDNLVIVASPNSKHDYELTLPEITIRNNKFPYAELTRSELETLRAHVNALLDR